jgi:hypothetical protein
MSHLKLVPKVDDQNPIKAETEDRYARLREVLARETFPMNCTHKLIGANTPAFEAGLDVFESGIQGLVRSQVRESQNKGHLSVTYQFTAPSIEAMIDMLEASSKVPDLKYML